jgi:hydrogenase-4 component F
VLAAALPWQLGAHGPFWRLDPLAVHVVLLLAALATAASWTQRNASPVWGSRLAILAGTALAVLSTDPLPRWLGMTVATIGVAAAALPARAEAWRRLRLGCTGLGLALFGTIALYAAALPQPASAIALHPAPALLPASVCIMLGYGTLAVLAPELTVAAVALILRMRGAPADDLLLALGLAAMLVATLGLATARGPQRRTLPLVGLAQGGAAVFAFGLGSESGNLAGLLQLSFLALTQCALLLARENGLDRLAARAGLAGLPPFGLFPSLALILVATAERLPWLLLALGAGLAAVAWAVLLQLPAGHRLRLSPAWLPLALLLIAGFAMPDPLLAWFRLAAR